VRAERAHARVEHPGLLQHADLDRRYVERAARHRDVPLVLPVAVSEDELEPRSRQAAERAHESGAIGRVRTALLAEEPLSGPDSRAMRRALRSHPSDDQGVAELSDLDPDPRHLSLRLALEFSPLRAIEDARVRIELGREALHRAVDDLLLVDRIHVIA